MVRTLRSDWPGQKLSSGSCTTWRRRDRRPPGSAWCQSGTRRPCSQPVRLCVFASMVRQGVRVNAADPSRRAGAATGRSRKELAPSPRDGRDLMQSRDIECRLNMNMSVEQTDQISPKRASRFRSDPGSFRRARLSSSRSIGHVQPVMKVATIRGRLVRSTPSAACTASPFDSVVTSVAMSSGVVPAGKPCVSAMARERSRSDPRGTAEVGGDNKRGWR